MVPNRKMLLADDSMTIQKIVQLTFADEGLDVSVVSNGEQAIEELQRNDFDIVLTDVFIPGRNGYEVCQYVKSSDRLRHIPVLLLIGTFEFYDAVEARRVGANDVLTKPFKSIKEMVNKVSTMLGSRTDEDTSEPTPPGQQSTAPPLEQNDQVLPLAASATEKRDSQDEMSDILIQTQPTAPLVAPGASVPETGKSFDTMLHTTEAFDQVDDAPPASIGTQQSHSTAVDANPMNANTTDDRTNNSMTNNQTGALPTPTLDTPASNNTSLEFGAIDSHQTKRLDAPPPAMPADDDFLLDLDDTGTTSGANNSSDAGFAPSFNSNHALSGQDSMILDLDDLPVRNQPTQVATSSGGETRNTVGFPQMPELLQGVPSATGSSRQQISLEQLSPEAIDAIARRVVEHLSDKVVREIAWEVVPQLSERLIKKRLEEENSGTR